MKKTLMVLLTVLILSLSLFAFTVNAETNYEEYLGNVTLTGAEVVSMTSVSLTWTNDSYSYYIDGYEIYRATSAKGTYSLIETLYSTYSTYYIDDNLTTGKTYYYKVRPFCEPWNEDVVYGKFSNAKSATPAPRKMTSLSAVLTKKNQITLTWDQTGEDIDGYAIYRSTSKNGTYKAIKRITEQTTTTYTDSKVATGKSYYYKIKPYVTKKGKRIYGAASDPVRNKIDISLCQPYFTKVGEIASDSSKIEKQLRLRYGDTILTEGKDYHLFIYSWWSSGGIQKEASATVRGMGNDWAGEMDFSINPISQKTQINSVSLTNSGIKVTWEKETGALGYKIFRKTGSGSYTAVKTISNNNTTSWTDKTATKVNTKYTYFVKAYTQKGSKQLLAKKSDDMSIKRLGTPKLKSVSNKKSGIVLKWGSVKGAKSYDILRKTGDGSWKHVATTTDTQYTDAKTRVGVTYTYTVCCSDNESETRVSYYNTKGLKAKRLVSAEGKSQSSNSVKITWNKATKADGYAVYRATSAKGTYKKIATIKKNSILSYTDKKLTFAKYYYYKVRPYSVENKKTVYGDYGTVVKVRPTVGEVSIKKAKATTPTKVKLTWGAVSKADGYQIYMATSKEGTYKKVKTVSGNDTTTYTVTKLKNANTYYFKIRGYRKVKGTTYLGDFSAVKSYYIDMLGYDGESYFSKTKRIWGTDYYKDYTSSKAAKKDMKTIKIKTWDIDSKGKKYTRYHNLTVHKNIATTVEYIFNDIYNGKEKFPIKSVGAYSWRGDYSSSEHCEGLAIDINPNENAQFNGDTGKPMVGSFWKPGKNPYSITANGEVVKIFQKYGFGWGNWFYNPDYMHFSYFGT